VFALTALADVASTQETALKTSDAARTHAIKLFLHNNLKRIIQAESTACSKLLIP
jgi:hypothetical protein